jgi:hypothetical protein
MSDKVSSYFFVSAKRAACTFSTAFCGESAKAVK